MLSTYSESKKEAIRNQSVVIWILEKKGMMRYVESARLCITKLFMW